MDRKTLVVLIATGSALLGWLLSVAFAFTTQTPRAPRPLLAWQDAGIVARGHAIYAAECAGCHGAAGGGRSMQRVGIPASVPLGPALNASGHAWQQPDFALVELVKSGTSAVMCLTLDPAMPRYRDVLGDRDILAVLAYLKSTWPEETRKQQDDVNAVYARQNALMRSKLGAGN